MIHRTNQIEGPSHLSAEASRRILYKLRDLNLSAERIRLEDGRRVDFKGCLDPDAPVRDQLYYRLVLDGEQERLLAITLERGRLCLALGRAEDEDAERSRWLNLAACEDGRVSAPEIEASIDPETTSADEVEKFLRSLTLACLPA